MDNKFDCNDEYAAFYGQALSDLKDAGSLLQQKLERLQVFRRENSLRDPVEHFRARIKSPSSMREKLKRRGLPDTLDSALNQVYDAVGVRVICTFVDDVYLIAELLRRQEDLKVAEEKDYIRFPKPNGYRSYHMIVQAALENGHTAYAEIQLRTLAMDCWASLEHQLKYKQDIPNQGMIVEELKRCADEMASTDLNLLAIRDMIWDETLLQAARPQETAREWKADEAAAGRG